MNKPRRIQIPRVKGWELPPNTVRVDQTTPWGNPYKVDEFRTPLAAVRSFAAILKLTMNSTWKPPSPNIQWMVDHLEELRGKDLACTCRRGAPCHADALLKLANVDPAPKVRPSTCVIIHETQERP